MRVYLAARYSLFQKMQEHAAQLVALGHTVTSRWILGDHDIRAHGEAASPVYMPMWALEDYEDLCAADTCVAFTEEPGKQPGRARGGRHVEFGMAIAAGKRVIVVGHRENVFHWLPQVEYCETWEQVLLIL